jgi:dihydropteroate synthase
MTAIDNISQVTTIGGRSFKWGARTYVMGIINVTTDSFSGDGLRTDVDAAVAQALAFQAAGADVIDVGGESSRPPERLAARAPSLYQQTRS